MKFIGVHLLGRQIIMRKGKYNIIAREKTRFKHEAPVWWKYLA